MELERESFNEIPHNILKELNAKKAVVMTTRKLNKVLGSTSLTLEDLHEIKSLKHLSELRYSEDVYSITMTVLKLDSDLINEATKHIQNRYKIISELDTLLNYEKDVYVVYVITHYNYGPLGPLTIYVGGDCYRTDKAIKDLYSILDRTKELAKAMLEKATLIFPDIRCLHGGKKGEWIILNDKGEKIDGISEDSIIALGSAIIPMGIDFLNKYKEKEAQELGIFESGFPEYDYVSPDSASPDVLSGVYWRGERKDKYINMCDAWNKRDKNLRSVTCLPDYLGGTRDESSRPTGYGVATTAATLSQIYFQGKKDKKDWKFLLEAAGGVGRNTIELLIKDEKYGGYGISPDNITVFDRNDAACKFVSEKYGVHTITLSNEHFYNDRLLRDFKDGITYDIWINNGEGDNASTQYINNLLKSGVKIFTGGANNFLKLKEKESSLNKIFENGGWAWTDTAASGGGWTLAVIDLCNRCQKDESSMGEITHKKSSANETSKLILDTIRQSNENLINDVMKRFEPNRPNGRELWDALYKTIHERVEEALKNEKDFINGKVDPEEAKKLANVKNSEEWKIFN